MNILIFSWRGPKHPLAGGAEQSVHEHAKGWLEAGHEVTLFTSFFKGGQLEEDIDGVHIIRKGNQIMGVHVMAFVWYLFSNHSNFDLIVDCFHGIPFCTPLFVGARKIALIQEVAKEVWFLNHLPKPINLLVGALGYLLEPIFFLLYRKIPFITASNSTKDDLIKFGIPSKNIVIIPHGVIAPTLNKIPTRGTTKTITFLGTLARDKGIEDAIRAFSILKKHGKFNFWVLGRGISEYVNYLKRLSVNLGIGEEIIFFGFVDEEEKFRRLAMSHVLVNPSIREGWGLVNIEANKMGVPVVAYRSPGLIDSVLDKKSGVICEDNTPETLARNIIKIISDGELYSSLSKNSVIWSNNFTWDKSKSLSLNFIQNTDKTST